MNPSPRDNFYRCMTLIVDNGNEAAWELLDYYLSKQGTTLKDFIENNQHEIYHLCYNNSRCCRCHHATVNKGRILFQTQLGVLLDTKGSNFPCFLHKHGKPTCSHTLNDNYANPNIATNQLDLTLCRCLLFNFTNILPHGSVERTAFGDLIEMRNMCCHAAKGEISSKDYKAYKAQIEKCLLDLAQVYGKTYDMQLKFKDAEKRPFDESICKELQHTILQVQVLQGVSGLKDHIESSREAEKHTSAEIQKMENSTKRTLQEVKSSKEIVEHTASKVQKLDDNIEKTLKAVEASQESVEITSAKLEKKQDKNTEETLQAVEYTTANIEKKLEESSKRTIQAVESSQKSIEHSTANIEKKIEESSKRTIQAVESSQKSVDHSTAYIEKKLEESSERIILAVKSNQILVEHTVTKIQKLQENTDKTIIDSSRKAEESTTNKIQMLEERLSKCETSKRSRLIGLTKTEIDGHLNEGTFVETPAVQACIKLLETNSLLILTGAAGTGKSRNSLEILHQFQAKYPEYKSVKLTDLYDFTDVVTEEEKLVILFEDIFGRTNTRFAENTDVQIIDRIHACTVKGNIKVVLTVRDTIRMSCQWILNSHKIFHGKCEVDISSEKFKMKKTEKESLLLKYFAAHNFKLLEYNDPENYFEEAILDPKITATVNRVTLHNIVESEPLLGFPEACSLFTGNRKLTRLGLSFFKHPSKYLFEEIEKLRKSGIANKHDRMSYVTLIYILLNEDALDPDDIELNICFDILESCYGISNKKLPACHITDAANEMIGRYLIFHCDDGTYHLQHQTIFESILISYSQIDPGLILSRLNFDFIREMVRLQNYTLREGEIVMKISSKYYSMLANRIIEIVLSEYFNKSLSLNFQLMCESEIIRQNDECFMKSLIEKAHDAYFQQEYDLQTFVTYRGVCKLCNLYLPALFLERISLQNKMNKSIILLVDQITSVLNSEPEENIEFVCKSSLIDAFLHVCELENNENILDNIWVPIKNLFISEMTEYIRSSRSRICSRCPITTMKWMLKNIDQSIFEMNYMLKRSCEFKRLDVVKFLCETINHDQFDFTEAFIAAINNVWNDPDEPVSKWLVQNVDHQLFDMKKVTSEVLVVGSVTDLKFLLENIDNNILDMKLVFTHLYKEGRHSVESFLKWMIAKVQKEKLNTLEMLILACMVQDIAVVKYLIKNVDHSLLDFTSVLMSAMNSDWRGSNTDLIEWLFLNFDLKYINMMHIINKAFKEGRYKELKILIICIKDNLLNINIILRNACENIQMEVIKVVLSVVDHFRLNIRDAVRSVCVLWKIDLLEYFLHNVNHNLYDAKYVMEISCRYGWIHIVQWLLDNVEYSSLDISSAMNIVLHRQFGESDKKLVRLFLQYPLQDKVQIAEIIHDCSLLDMLDVVKWMLKKIDQRHLDMKVVMNTACSRSYFDVVQWLLSNVDNDLFDIPTAFNKAIHAYRPDLTVSLIKLLINRIDNELIDMASLLKIKDTDCLYDIVECVLESVDHNKFDFKEAFNTVYDKIHGDDDNDINYKKEKYQPLIQLILEKVNPESLEFKDVLNQSCRDCSLDVVNLLLENIDHKKLDVKKAMNIVYNLWVNNKDEGTKGQEKEKQYENDESEEQEMEEHEGGDKEDEDKEGENINEKGNKYTHLVKLILKQVNHDSLDLKKVFNQACQYGCLDVVTLVLENYNHTKLDVMKAVKIIYSSVRDKFDDIIDRGEKYELLIKLILEKVNHDSLDFKEIMNKACRYGCLDIVTFVLQNIDLKKSDIMEAVSIVCDSPYRNNVNRDSIVLKIMYKASCSGYLEVVTFVLENTDHKKIDIMEAVNIIYSSIIDDSDNMMDQIEKYEPLIRQILEKVNHDLLDLKTVFKHAFCKRCLEVVRNLLENTDHGKLDVKGAMNIVMTTSFDPRRSLISKMGKMKEPVIKLILEKVNHDSLALKDIMNYACCNGLLDVVTCLLENTDHKKLDIMEAVNVVFRSTFDVRYYNNVMNNLIDTYDPLIRHILEKVNHELLDLETIFHLACRIGCLEVVAYLLENINHDQLDAKKAVNDLYRSVCDVRYYNHAINNLRDTYDPLIRHILEKVNHDLLDLKTIFHLACRIGCLKVVTYLLENTNHDQLDAKEGVNVVYLSVCNDDDYYDVMDNLRQTYDPLIRHILEKINHDLLDLKTIFFLACRIRCLKVVAYLLENINHDQLDVKEAVNDLFRSSVCNVRCYDGVMNNLRKEYQPLIRHILEKVNHDLLDLKTIFYVACKIGCLEVVTYLLEKKDHTTVDLMGAVKKLCYPSIHEYMDDKFWYVYSNEAVIKLLLPRVKVDILDVEVLLNVACRQEWLDIVRWLVENVAHSMFDIDTSMNVLMLRSTENNLAIFKILLENISQTLFNIRSVIEQALRINHTEKGLLLLQIQNNTLFDIKYVMNEACRNSNLLVIKYVMENIDKKYFDVRSAMNKACRSAKPNSLEVVKLLLENIPHNMLNLESAMNNACRYDNVDVVRWFWDNLDRKLFNEKSSWNNAFYNCNEKMISYLLNNMDENMLDKSKALSKACHNIREGDKIMALLFKQPNMKTPENCKQVMTEACVHCNINVVKWLMSHTDIQPLVYKTSLIDTIKATINMTNNRGKSDRISIVQFMLEHDSIKKLGQNDMSEVMEAVSSIGHLDMVQRLWHNTAQRMFNMRAIVNTACESGQFEIVDWFLRNNELKHIDVQTVMLESCGYGWLKIVMMLLFKFGIEHFDMRTSMNEACSYGRYEIVKFLLENVDSNLLDTRLVLEKACGYGWKDIIYWLFDHIDNIYFDSKECIFEACAQGRLEIVELFWSKFGTNNLDVDILIDISCKNSANAGVMKFLIENFELTQSHKDIIIRYACKYSWIEIVKSLIDVCKLNKNLMEEAMKTSCISGETEIVEIFLDKIDISFLGVNTNMNISCQKGWDEIVSLLLERVDHFLFDFTAAMNEACRCGEADVVELLIQKVNRENFNFNTAIVEACKSHLNENLVIILLKYINRSTSDIETVSEKAYDYGWRKVSSQLKRMIYNDISK